MTVKISQTNHFRSLLLVFGLRAVTGCDSENDDAASDETSGAHGLDTTSAAQVETSDTSDAPFFTEDERQAILTWLAPLPADPPADLSNSFADDPRAARLGQALFFDTGYSEGGAVSCATCHAPTTGFDDARANTSLGLAYTPRSAMPIINGAFGAASEDAGIFQFWDGRCDSQWSQALQPPESAAEMGSSRTTVALHLFDNYRAAYEEIFGSMPDLRDASGNPAIPAKAVPGEPAWDTLPEATQDDVNRIYANFGKAIAAYERRLQSRNSRFDQFWSDLNAGSADSDAITDQEKAGLRVFMTARCVGCHGGPNFTDGQFHNIAVAQTGTNIPVNDAGRATGLQRLVDDLFNCAGPYSDHPDKSLCAVSQIDTQVGEMGAFKTPSLRGVTFSAPYMHTGTFPTLAEVVAHYDIGGALEGTFDGVRDELMRPLGLTGDERNALVAFMSTLDGEPLDPALLGPPR